MDARKRDRSSFSHGEQAFRQAVDELKIQLEPQVRAELTAKWEAVIARDLLQKAQTDLDAKRLEVEARLRLSAGSPPGSLPGNQEALGENQ